MTRITHLSDSESDAADSDGVEEVEEEETTPRSTPEQGRPSGTSPTPFPVTYVSIYTQLP